MPCDQSHLLSSYLDGELSASNAAAVRDHLASCAECATEAESLRAVGRLMAMARRSNMGEPSEQVLDRLRLHVREMVETSEYGLLRIARLFTGLAASVLIAGLWLLNHHPVAPVVQPIYVSMVSPIVPEEFDPKPDPGVEVVPAEPATPDDAIQSLMGMPEARLDGELP